MSFIITRPHHAINGRETEMELMEHHETGEAKFRTYFETNRYKPLSFETPREAIRYLDLKFPDSPKIYLLPDIANIDVNDYLIIEARSEGDRTLEVWARLKEEIET